MDQKIELGTINAQGELRFQCGFEMDSQEWVTFQFHCDQFQWNVANIYDNQGDLRLQIIDAKQMLAYSVGRAVEVTSPNGIFGELPAGEWTVEGIIYGAEGQSVYLDVESDKSDKEVHHYVSWLDQEGYVDFSRLERPLAESPQWLKCDLHTHTILSDGSMTIEDNQIQAEKMDLDFYVATDHNIMTSMWLLNDQSPMVYPGVELTSPLGHFNLLFGKDFIFRHHRLQDLEHPADFLQLIKTIKDQEMGLVSINHPFLTIWKWLLHDLPLDWIDALEIINDPSYPANMLASLQALKFWDAILNDGHFIPIVGGSDSHLRPDDKYEGAQFPSLIGDPGTYIYSQNMSAEALKLAIKKGHVVVSRFGFLEAGFNDWIPGDRVSVDQIPDKIDISVQYHCNEERVTPRLELVLDGDIIQSSSELESNWEIAQKELSGDYHWMRVQVINQIDGQLLAVSNPLIIGQKENSFMTWADVLQVVPDTTPDE